MNNLVVLHAVPVELSEALEGDAVLIDVDTKRGVVFGVSEDGRVVGVKSGEAVPPLLDADIPYGGGVVCLKWLPELDSVFAACKGGQMLLINEDTGIWETVGELDGGLLCASWSTDEEVLFCVTGGGTLVLLNTTWDVLAERQMEGEPPVTATMAWNGDGLKGCLLTCESPRPPQTTGHDTPRHVPLVLPAPCSLMPPPSAASSSSA